MKGIDTNVLARFLTRDDPVQSPRAARLIVSSEQAGDRLHISVITLCELLWVLERTYRFQKAELVFLLDKLLATGHFLLQHRDRVRRALNRFRHGRADFADYLIGEENAASGATPTLTFDRTLGTEDGFELVG